MPGSGTINGYHSTGERLRTRRLTLDNPTPCQSRGLRYHWKGGMIKNRAIYGFDNSTLFEILLDLLRIPTL